MSSDDYDRLGGIINPLEHTSYEVESPTNVFDAMEVIKSSRKKTMIRGPGTAAPLRQGKVGMTTRSTPARMPYK